jgi:hypothetical protein
MNSGHEVARPAQIGAIWRNEHHVESRGRSRLLEPEMAKYKPSEPEASSDGQQHQYRSWFRCVDIRFEENVVNRSI